MATATIPVQDALETGVTSADLAIKDAKTWGELESVINHAEHYYAANQISREQLEAIAMATWQRSKQIMAYDSALLKKQQQLLDDYDEWTQKRREQLVDEMMKARENIINQVVVESLNEEPNGSYVKIYLRDDGEQSE